MAATPRNVHWAIDATPSDLGSPFSNASSEHNPPTSTLAYVNSQLIAHGFVPTPGLSLDGLGNVESERVLKCVLSMLGHRMEDMSRTEEMTTRLRILSYDYERLQSMYRSSEEKAANAEREMNMHKSKLSTAQRALSSSQSAHKQTTLDLQRTRTALQGVRATHAAELKKKEKECERMVERWSKLAESQVKLGAAGSGLTFSSAGGVRSANAEAVEGKEVGGRGCVDVSLEQAENTRKALADENAKLKGMTLRAVNGFQTAVHTIRSVLAEKEGREMPETPTPESLTTLFPLHPPNYASEKLASIFNSLHEWLDVLCEVALANTGSGPSSSGTRQGNASTDGEELTKEIEKMRQVIDSLRTELSQARAETAAHAAQSQALFDRISATSNAMAGPSSTADTSVDLIAALSPSNGERLQRELAEERARFTEACVRLGKERAVLEADRARVAEERRAWEVERMLAELPPTPLPGPSASTSPGKSRRPGKSPRKVTAVAVGVGAKGRKTRISRRSSTGPGLSPSKHSQKVAEPAYETEVIPPIRHQEFSATTGFVQQPDCPQPPVVPSQTLPSQPPTSAPTLQGLLATSFVLPPPSPATSLPPQHDLLAPLPPHLPPPPPLQAPPQIVQAEPKVHAPPPVTPGTRFPQAKPFARGMVHAYSPARPSPLSRILSLADSPADEGSEGSTPLGTLMEEEGESGGMFPAIGDIGKRDGPARLGAGSAMDGKTGPVLSSVSSQQGRPPKAKSAHHPKGKVFRPPLSAQPEQRQMSSRQQEKSKAAPAPAAPAPPSATGASNKRAAAHSVEKENDTKRARGGAGADVRGAARPGVGRGAAASGGGGVGGGVGVGKVPRGRGGARRVLIDSAEAAPVGPGRKT